MPIYNPLHKLCKASVKSKESVVFAVVKIWKHGIVHLILAGWCNQGVWRCWNMQHVGGKRCKEKLSFAWCKVLERGRCINTLILNLATRWRWVASFTPQLPSPQRKTLQYSFHRRLGGHRGCLNVLEKRQISHSCRESDHYSSDIQASA